MEELRGLYIISVAARLLDMHPQTLRKYERVGLVKPSRTMGMLRLYSAEDVARLRLIKHLVERLGLNLAGVDLTLSIATKLLQMHQTVSSIEGEKELRRRTLGEIEDILEILGVQNV